MKPVEYVVMERTVRQYKPDVYKNNDSYVAVEQLNALLENSRKSWDDIEMVYQLCEHRISTKRNKRKDFEVVGLYLQGKPGKSDYKYMDGLSFLVPVRSVHKEIMEFFEGGWCS